MSATGAGAAEMQVGTAAPESSNDSASHAERMLEAALGYASEGLYVFPLSDEDKVPITRHGHGHLDATTDESRIRAWWTKHPNARIGVHLRASGLIAVDVDVADGKRGDLTFAALESELGALARTNHQRSGRGGQHIILRDPSPGPDGWTRTQETGGRARGKLGPGVDLKINGYIVLAPSGSYRWLARDLSNVAEVPTAWIEVMRKRDDEVSSTASVEAWSESTGELDEVSSAALRSELAALGPRGSGKGTTFAAIKLVHHDYGQSVDGGAAILRSWSDASGKPHSCSELSRQVERIAVKLGDESDRGWRLDARGLDGVIESIGRPTARTEWERELASARADVERAIGAGTREAHDVAPLFERASDLLSRSFPEEPWLVGGLVKRGGTLVVSGEPKTGKSWVLTEIAMAVASGTLAFGEFSTGERRRVAYFYAEDLGADVRSHLIALATGRDLDTATAVENLLVQPRGRFLDVLQVDHLALIVASVRRLGGVELLCIEPLRDIHGGEEDTSDSMRNVMRNLRVLGEVLGCTMAVAHHTAKAGGDSRGRRQGQRMRGSSAIHGAIDSGLYLSDPDGNGSTVIESRVTSEVKGARSGGEFNLRLEIEDGPDGRSTCAGWTVTRGEPAVEAVLGLTRDAKDDAAVLARVRELAAGGHPPMTKSELRVAVPGVPDKRARAAIGRLTGVSLKVGEWVDPTTRVAHANRVLEIEPPIFSILRG